MGSITRRVVNRVSSRTSSSQTTFVKSGLDYDVAVGGQPFLLSPSRDRPYVRKTGPYRKDQIDQTPIPGEQSMVFWWLRSQVSFHGGTGILFEEPALDPGILYSDPLSAVAIPLRYQDSEGVDPLTQPGHVTLLPGTTLNASDVSSGILVLGAQDANGVDMYLHASTTALKRCVEGSSTTITAGNSGTILSLAQDGTNYYAADSTGIYKGTLAGGAGSLAWNTGSSKVVTRWVKDRLVAAIGLSLYELVGGSPPTLPTAFYTAQMPNWTWTSITEGPDGIYVAGYAGNVSKIFFIGLTTGVGNTPILAPPVEVAELPRGEIVQCIQTCLGSYLAIGSNRGVRLADFQGSGRLAYGPMFVQLPTGASPVYSITNYDRYLYAAWGSGMADGTSGLMRIDLGFQTQFQHFAYCKDLRSHTAGAVHGVTQFGASGRLVFSVDGHGSYIENTSAQNLESTGYLQTGNIRFHTMEPKLFKKAVLQGSLPAGSVKVTQTASDGSSTDVITMDTASGLVEFSLPFIGPVLWTNMKFTLTASGSLGPTLFSYQVKALPAQKNQRNIILPVMCFDHEADKQGGKAGYEGYARARLEALEAVEEARDVITYQDFSRNPFEQRLVVIDDLQFMQTDPPTEATGTGGYLQITLRTVD